MTTETALRLLGLSGAPDRQNIDAARRQMLAALHPDKHPGANSDLFQRLASDINEAHSVLTSEVAQSQLRNENELEAALFDVHASSQWNRVTELRGSALAPFDRRYAKDKIVAVAVLGLDPRFTWFTSNAFSGGQQDHSGTALYLLIWNRTRRRVESLDASSGLLVDDRGNQYSSDGTFYWTDDGEGSFNRHSDTLVPNAKLDGFLLYPGLRTGASAYVRWYLADTIKIGEKWIDAEYDVELPREPQERALLSAGLTTVPIEDNADIDLDDYEQDDAKDELDDDWLYGKD